MNLFDMFESGKKQDIEEACWKGYHKEGMKTMFGKRYPNCVKNKNESLETYVNKGECPGCGGAMVSEEQINEKQDACYHKVKSRYKVWPSAYASGALVQCRKKGAANWGNKNESITQEEYDQLDENLKQWFSDKWVRFGPDGKIRGDCARGDSSEGKPKCLPQSKAHALGKKGRASAAARKRREDPNPERSGKAINVNTKKKTSEGVAEGNDDHIWGPQGNFAGDRIVNLGGVTMKTVEVGDTVKYFGQKAKVVAMSKDRKHSRINILSDFGGTTRDVLTSDLKQLGQGVAEAINPDITNPEFSHQQQIGDYLYVARYWSKGLKITAYDGNKKIGYAELMYQSAPFDDFADPKTTPKRVWLESEWTKVDPKYQRQGIMSTMYAYAKMLGNSVKPSQTRSDDAKAAWKSWRDAGDAQHLTREGVVEAFGPLPREKQQIRLGRHTVDIERVGEDKDYFSFAWHDSQGQEHYQEVPVGDLGSYDDLIDRIKDEIRYQERQYTDQGVAEGSTDTVYPNATVIKSKNGRPVGEIYQDGNSWGCFHYRADRGYDFIDSREEAIEALKDLHQETGRSRPDYTIKGVAEGLVERGGYQPSTEPDTPEQAARRQQSLQAYQAQQQAPKPPIPDGEYQRRLQQYKIGGRGAGWGFQPKPEDAAAAEAERAKLFGPKTTQQSGTKVDEQGVAEAKKKKKSSRSTKGYFFPGYAYYGGSESGDSGGEGVEEGSNKKQEATRRIQKMLNDKFGANLDVDGVLGPLTLKSINKFMPNAKVGPAKDPNKTTAVQGKKVKNEDIDQNQLAEKWSQKYKSSINCSNPKGFSQRAHCDGKKKNEDVTETTEYNYSNINDDDWYEFDSEGNVVRQSGPGRYKLPFGSNNTIKLPNGNIAAKGMTAKRLKLFKNLSESREYYNVTSTDSASLRQDFNMSKDRFGWHLSEGATPKHKLDAYRAFGSPKLKEYDLSAFSGGTQTKGEDNVISPVGSQTRSQYKK